MVLSFTVKKTAPKVGAPTQEIMPPFDYGDVPKAIVNDIEAVAKTFFDRQESARKIAVQYAVDQGRLLHKVKERLEHGQFIKWIDKRLGVSDQTARNYMGAATLADKSQMVLDLPVATVYKIAAPNTPPELQQEIIAKLESGEKPKPYQIVAQIDAAKEKIAKQKAEAAKAKGKTPEQIAKEKKAKKDYAEKKAKAEAALAAAWEAKQEAEKKAAVEAVTTIAACLGDKLPIFATLYKQASYHFKSALDAAVAAMKGTT